MSRIDHLENVIKIKQRRLNLLLQKKAKMVTALPVHEEAEIEDLEKEIPQLKTELTEERRKINGLEPPIPVPTSQVEIKFNRPLKNVAEGKIQVDDLAHILGRARRQFKLLEAQDDTIRVELPTEVARELLTVTDNEGNKKLLPLNSEPAFQLSAASRADDSTIRIQTIKLLLRFQNREVERGELLGSSARHIELYGPAGVGKTYMLKHIAHRHSHVYNVYLKLTDHNTKEAILTETLRQLTGQKPLAAVDFHSELATALQQLHQQAPFYSHFVFALDAVKNIDSHKTLINWLIGPEGLINHEDFLDYLDTLNIRGDLKLQVIIATRNKMIKPSLLNLNDYFALQPYKIDNLTLRPIVQEDGVYLMLEDLLGFLDKPIQLDRKNKITRGIHYISTGHPRCIESVLFALGKVNFFAKEKRWQNFFNKHVLPIIETEMLQPEISSNLRPVFEVLSVFRHFDDVLLITLLEKGLIAYPPAGRTPEERATDLRRELGGNSLINEPAEDEPMFTMNFMARRALELNLVYNNPERYQAINQQAPDLLTERLAHPERLSSAERTAKLFIYIFGDILYHQIKELEFSRAKVDICPVLEEKLTTSLPLLSKAIGTQLRRLPALWEKDKELREAVNRATGTPNCYGQLLKQINDFVEECKKSF